MKIVQVTAIYNDDTAKCKSLKIFFECFITLIKNHAADFSDILVSEIFWFFVYYFVTVIIITTFLFLISE